MKGAAGRPAGCEAGRRGAPPARQQVADGACREGQLLGNERGIVASLVEFKDALAEVKSGGGRHKKNPK
jgi:hypothetical protein